jgi:hypothetical protein
MIQRRIVFLLLALAPTLLSAQGSSVGSSQLKIPVNARTAAMGESTVSDANQFSSWLLNPANLYTKGPIVVELTHSQWIQEVQSEFIGAQMPMAFGTLGFSVSTITVPGIEVRDAPGPAVGTFSARFASVQLGFARTLVDDLAIGVAGKYLYEKLYADDATGVGFDIGLLYHSPIHGLDAAVSVTNAGSLEAYRSEASGLPTFMREGASYAFSYKEFTLLTYAAFANNLKDSENHAEGSFEATYKDLITVRLGYETGYDSRGITAGLGVRYEFMRFDYAYVPFSLGLGDGHLFSLRFQF